MRGGVRRTTLVGLLVFAVSAAAFGFGTDIVALDALRFVQGVGLRLHLGRRPDLGDRRRLRASAAARCSAR